MEKLADLERKFETNSRARDFVRLAICMMSSRSGEVLDAAPIFEARYGKGLALDLINRAAVPALSADGNALAPTHPLSAAFVELIRPRTVIGRLAGARRAPFMTRFGRQTAGASVGWVGQGRPAKMGKLAFDFEELSPSKISGIVCFTDELVRRSVPGAEQLIRSDLLAATIAFTDEAFLDPLAAAVPDVSPASVTYGAPQADWGGSFDGDTVTASLKDLLAAISTNFETPYLIMSGANALEFAAARATMSGNFLFPNVGIKGGDIWQVPVLVSDAAGSLIVAIDAAELLLADDGDIELSASREATVELLDTPTNDSIGPTATTMVSLYQTNSVGLKILRTITWKMRRDGAVAYMDSASG